MVLLKQKNWFAKKNLEEISSSTSKANNNATLIYFVGNLACTMGTVYENVHISNQKVGISLFVSVPEGRFFSEAELFPTSRGGVLQDQ